MPLTVELHRLSTGTREKIEALAQQNGWSLEEALEEILTEVISSGRMDEVVSTGAPNVVLFRGRAGETGGSE